MSSGKTIFDLGAPGRGNRVQHVLGGIGNEAAATMPGIEDIPAEYLRARPPALPEVSELQVVRHYTTLSAKNFSIDTRFYPLGSCTMKYNPRGVHHAASLPGFLTRHPLTPECRSQGFLSVLHELQGVLQAVTGMAGISLAPMAGAQGELAGVAMIKAYHEHRGDKARTEFIVPTAAHGTNPASATMCGYTVVEVPVAADGDVEIEALKEALGPKTAGIMLTNPSTCGVFERRIREIADLVHGAGGLLYYDGANLNAILGKVRPGDMGFDVIHVNLHKTFATPHGGGGPGAGPVGVSERLLPFLPTPFVRKGRNLNAGVRGASPPHKRSIGRSMEDASELRESSERAETLHWVEPSDLPTSIGRLSTFAGNAGILVRALAYARLLGGEGMRRVAEYATLNANYLAVRLAEEGFELAYPTRRASHEFIITFRAEAREYGISAMDVAKRLLDFGIHAPTTYFPLLIPECFLIEPTETETKETLDAFIEAMVQIRDEMRSNPELIKQAPHTLPISRLDDVKAARELDIRQQL